MQNRQSEVTHCRGAEGSGRGKTGRVVGEGWAETVCFFPNSLIEI